ncbi:IS3 family transposase, partial [Halomonas beimenensis]
GIHPKLLGRWRRELVTTDDRQPKGVPNAGPHKSQHELERENRRLKKRLERAELEVEILKKANEYFAKDPK